LLISGSLAGRAGNARQQFLVSHNSRVGHGRPCWRHLEEGALCALLGAFARLIGP
jgi:hypothetical protein